MNVAFRLDASLRIGSGHFMRCLCLADALAGQGARVQFLCRPLPAHLAALLRERGYGLAELPAWDDEARAVESAWDDDFRARDLQDCEAALAGAPADWLVVDHYGADRAWEQAAHGFARRVLALDDLGREHACEVLLDANHYPAGAAEYAGRVPAGCTCLVGPAHALLRPEFQQAHAEAQVRDGAVRRLLVFLGGMDAGDFTSLALQALAALPVAERPARTDVVIGPTHPRRAAIEAACAALPGAVVHAGTSEMARLCLASDLAIGAGGSATWERCATGLPTLALEVAPNQATILRHAARAGLLYTPDADPLDAAALALHLRALLANSGLRSHLSRRGLEAVDARGAARVAAAMKP